MCSNHCKWIPREIGEGNFWKVLGSRDLESSIERVTVGGQTKEHQGLIWCSACTLCDSFFQRACKGNKLYVSCLIRGKARETLKIHKAVQAKEKGGHGTWRLGRCRSCNRMWKVWSALCWGNGTTLVWQKVTLETGGWQGKLEESKLFGQGGQLEGKTDKRSDLNELC